MAELSLPAHLRSFLQDWSDREGRFARIPCVWLEVDLGSAVPAAGFPTPAVCVRLPRHAELGWVLETLLPALHGERASPSQVESLRRCHGEIPPAGSLLYVFSLLSRPGRAMRMEFFGLDPDAATAYLRRVAPHAAPALAAIAPLFAGIDRPHLSFDLGESGEVLPRVGLEGSFARQRDPRWPELLARLVARGLCTPAERDAIAAWPGYDSFWTAAAEWPLEAAGPRGFCVRSLSHVKVAAQPGQEPEAKVYLLLSSLATREGPDAERDQEAAGAEVSDGVASSTARRSAFST
jgi:hypothetical protein